MLLKWCPNCGSPKFYWDAGNLNYFCGACRFELDDQEIPSVEEVYEDKRSYWIGDPEKPAADEPLEKQGETVTKLEQLKQALWNYLEETDSEEELEAAVEMIEEFTTDLKQKVFDIQTSEDERS